MSDLKREFKRDLVQGSTLGVGVILVFAILGLVNYLAARHYQRLDWTAENRFTLSEKTLNLVQSLEEDLEFILFLDPQESPAYEDAKEMLQRYAAASPRISLREVDSFKSPMEAQRLIDQHQIDHSNVVVVATEGDRRVIDEADLLELDYSAMQMGGGPEVKGFLGEQAFTSAMVALIAHEKPSIAWITGHGEVSLDDLGTTGVSTLRRSLGDDNFDLEEVATLGLESFSDSVDLVVIAGPKTAFLEPELAILDTFAKGGGRLLIALDPSLNEDHELAPSGFEAWLASQGVLLGADVVVDPAGALPFFGAETFYAEAYGSHELTKSLSEASLPTIFALARSVSPADAEGLRVSTLVSTSPEGWGETSLGESLADIAQDESDAPGPVSLGVVVETEETDLASAAFDSEETLESDPEVAEEDLAYRMVVIGDSDILTDAQFGQAGNPAFVLNVFNWLAKRDAQLGIPPKDPSLERLNLTPSQLGTIQWIVVLMPFLAAVLGFFVWNKRRR